MYKTIFESTQKNFCGNFLLFFYKNTTFGSGAQRSQAD